MINKAQKNRFIDEKNKTKMIIRKDLKTNAWNTGQCKKTTKINENWKIFS